MADNRLRNSLYNFEIRRDVTSGKLFISGEVPWNMLLAVQYAIYRMWRHV